MKAGIYVIKKIVIMHTKKQRKRTSKNKKIKKILG